MYVFYIVTLFLCSHTHLVVADYFDRRSQARYMAENPNSALSPDSRPQFRSALADPAYQAQSRGLIGALSGGALGGRHSYRRERRAERRAYKDFRRVSRGKSPRGPRRQQEMTPGYAPKGIGRIMQKDVLYLTIVNLPTDEELALAVKTLNGMQDEAPREEEGSSN